MRLLNQLPMGFSIESSTKPFFNHSLNMSNFQLCSIDMEEIGREGGMGRIEGGEGR